MSVSACTFVSSTFIGAFCLFESMASLLPFVDEMLIMNIGSTDGTREILQDIASHNPKVKVIIRDNFPYHQPGVFADLANQLIAMCKNDRVIFWQSDEVWHEDLLRLMAKNFEAGLFDLSFWRIQYANNFQYVKWFPHLVHRVGTKDTLGRFNEGKSNFDFVGDGMNTTRQWDARPCSSYGGEYFTQWGDMGQEGIKPYVNEMICDISLIGGFRDNIPGRKGLHLPFWNEAELVIPYHANGKQADMRESEWMARAMADDDWAKPESPYNLPHILKWHVGRVKYELRPELLEALRQDDTRELIGF